MRLSSPRYLKTQSQIPLAPITNIAHINMLEKKRVERLTGRYEVKCTHELV